MTLTTKFLVAALFVTAAGLASATKTVYIALGSANQVIAVDSATGQITKAYTGVENPHGLVATPDGEYLIAGSLSEKSLPQGTPADRPNSRLYVIHPAHGHVMSTIPVAGSTHHQAITPDGRYVISTHLGRGYITVIDMTTEKVIHTIKTGQTPNYTLVTRDGKSAFVSNTGDGTLTEIGIPQWKAIRRLDAGPTPEHMVFSSDQKRIFVASARAGKVSVVNVSTGKIEREFNAVQQAHGIDLGDDGKTLFVSDRAADKLVAVNTETGAIRTLALSPAPYHLGVIPGTGNVYVSSTAKPQIWVIDQKQLKVVSIITLPAGEGHQLAFSR